MCFMEESRLANFDGKSEFNGPRLYFSSSTQPSRKFPLLIKNQNAEIKTFLDFKLSNVVFIMLLNVKIPQKPLVK